MYVTSSTITSLVSVMTDLVRRERERPMIGTDAISPIYSLSILCNSGAAGVYQIPLYVTDWNLPIFFDQ